MLSEVLSKILPAPLLAELNRLRNEILKQSHDFIGVHSIDIQNTNRRKSIHNLSHYLALRQHDLRQIQERLAEKGLSSLGRCESHVMATLNQVISILSKKHNPTEVKRLLDGAPSFLEGESCLKENAASLFGDCHTHQHARIMVTMPVEAATNVSLVDSLIENGMDVARINCAHDSPDTWEKIIDNIRSRTKLRDCNCKIMMDLAGQKIRTGPISQQDRVVRIRVRRNAYGVVSNPTFIELYPAELFPNGRQLYGEYHSHSIPVPQQLLKQLQFRDRLSFNDARGKSRKLIMRARQRDGIWLASTEQNIYLTKGVRLQLQLQRKDKKWHDIAQGTIPSLGTQDEIIRLRVGDEVRLSYAQTPASVAQYDAERNVLKPAQISCTQPEALKQVQVGQTVWIDDGKLCAVVKLKDPLGLLLTVSYAPKHGLRLKADKGINFPQTNLDLPSLTEKDRHDLDFICLHADAVGLSFAQTAEDIKLLEDEMKKRNAQHRAIIAKIETQKGVDNLPEIILQGLKQDDFGIMIARGDLAVELGGERLVEMQEEILWLCESAHVPVVWATQVLETLSKDGIVNRPELTDAAMAGRAECVMLNKGPFITRAVKTLEVILSCMEAHQYKKGARLRALHQWD